MGPYSVPLTNDAVSGSGAPAPKGGTMPLAMADSTVSLNLPAGLPAYLGYVDGNWPTIHGYTDANGTRQPPLRELFPAAHLIGLTVTGATLDADGIDVEPGNPNAAAGADWVARKLAAHPGSRPVVYADLESAGYRIHDVMAAVSAQNIPLTSVRWLSAHYWGPAGGPYREHVCGPHSCGLIQLNMDGTQWSDHALGVGGTFVDMSTVVSSFFSGGPVTTPAAPITALPPGNWTTAVLTGPGGDGKQYTAYWDGKAWHTNLWPVPHA